MDSVCYGCNEGLHGSKCATPCPVNCISCFEEYKEDVTKLDLPDGKFKNDFDYCAAEFLPISNCEECNGITGRLTCRLIYYPFYTFVCTTFHEYCRCWNNKQGKSFLLLKEQWTQCLKDRNITIENGNEQTATPNVVCSKCRAGYYGVTCQHNCSVTCNDGCNKDTGECTKGCLRGFFGPYCNITNIEIERLMIQGKHVLHNI